MTDVRLINDDHFINGLLTGLVKKVHSMQQEDTLCDVSFTVGGRVFRAHRVILAAASPYFYAMFTNDMLESKTGEVQLQDVEPDIFKELMNFVYTAKIKINDENVLEMLAASNFYQFNKVKEDCSFYLKHRYMLYEIRPTDPEHRLATQFVREIPNAIQGNQLADQIEQDLKTENILNVWSLASLCSCTDLMSACNLFMNHNLVEVSKSERFTKLNRNELSSLLSRDILDVPTNDEILKAVLIWVREDKDNRLSIGEELLKEVLEPDYYQNLADNGLMKSIQCRYVLNKSFVCSPNEAIPGCSADKAIPESSSNVSPPVVMKPKMATEVRTIVEGIKNIETIHVGCDSEGIVAVAWLNKKIYVLVDRRDDILVYTEDGYKYLHREKFRINEIKGPRDMKACRQNSSLYIVDDFHVIKLALVANQQVKTSVWTKSLDQCSLSVTSSGDAMLAGEKVAHRHACIDIYKSSDGRRMRIHLDSKYSSVLHAVENSEGNIFVFYSKHVDRPDGYISDSEDEDDENEITDVVEMSYTGHVYRSWSFGYDIGQIRSLSMIGDDKIIICARGYPHFKDYDSGQVLVVSLKQMNAPQVLLRHKSVNTQKHTNRADAIEYNAEKQVLLVGERCYDYKDADSTCNFFKVYVYKVDWAPDSALSDARLHRKGRQLSMHAFLKNSKWF